MKLYLFSVYILLLSMVAVLLHNHMPLHQTLAAFFIGGAFALVPVVISGKRTPEPGWLTVEEFEARGLNRVSVKLKYKGCVVNAFYVKEQLGGFGRFYYRDGTLSCYMTECITGVNHDYL